MTNNLNFDSSKQSEGSFIRQNLETNIQPLVKSIVQRLKIEATPAYSRLNDYELRKIVEGALQQTCRWVEDGPAARIELDLQDGLSERLKLGFTVKDFVSTTGIIEDECKKFCRKLFQSDPALTDRAVHKIGFIYVNVNLIETRLAMKYRQDTSKNTISKK
ncbi:MAG: hypothetical protein J0I20_27630 [Chloroflexi bacterium]|nr:hypothetical protein [Chloroflexota bacterium]OJV95849.1 MAG: hypothetical protein BGO39_21280 [Chloroflexi bacterium 54-19]